MARENRLDEYNDKILTLGATPVNQDHRILACLCIIDELTSTPPNDGRLYAFYRWSMLQHFTLFEKDYGLLCKRWHENERLASERIMKRQQLQPMVNEMTSFTK